jgi:hypothetical protein
MQKPGGLTGRIYPGDNTGLHTDESRQSYILIKIPLKKWGSGVFPLLPLQRGDVFVPDIYIKNGWWVKSVDPNIPTAKKCMRHGK